MNKIYLLLCLLLTSTSLSAQNGERVISGQLKSTEDGSPLPGVNITIKGTTTGTITDVDGRYSLRVPIGSIVVFSFIGMQTREVLVTETGLQSSNGNIQIKFKSPKTNWSPSILQDTVVDREGVTTLTFNTPSYKVVGSDFTPSNIVTVRKAGWLISTLFNAGREEYLVHTNNDRYTTKGFHLQFSGSVGFETPGKLPSLQSNYAQGRNSNGVLTWGGPDQLEVMSWGPAIKTLEYTGNTYAYDRNGTITTPGNGNGKLVNAYSPYQFFQTGITTTNEVVAFFPGLKGSTSRLDWSGKSIHGVIPNNNSRNNNVSFSMKRIRFTEKLTSDILLQYNTSQGSLMNRGANLSNIIGSIMRTPATFDNANGYSSNAASENPLAYRLPDGSVRSAAPGYIDNPFGLINELPDYEKVNRIVSSLAMNYKKSYRVDLSLSASYDKQRSEIINGIFPGLSGYVAGRRTERTEERENKSVNVTSNFKPEVPEGELLLSVAYQFRQEQRNVTRTDGFGFLKANFGNVSWADSLNQYALSLPRNIHEVILKSKYEYRSVDFQLTNRSYFSSTLDSKNIVNLFPALSVKTNLREFFYSDFINDLRPFVSVARTIREAPLLFGNNSFLSTQLTSAAYNTYFENKEIPWNSQLKPETEIKFEAGVTTQTRINLQLDFAYYNNTTYSLILPVSNGGQPLLQNAATINNTGINTTLSYNPWLYGDVRWGVSLRWTKYNSIVTNVDLPADHVPLAGFSDIQTVLAKGQPLGAIYGTTFQRDDAGRKIIGTDGFPLVDHQLKSIGNPIPDFLISLEPNLTIKQRLKFAFVIDFKSGGQIWNGTKAALNYFGRGQETADQRNIANYIYDGVTASGVVNSTPVSFYDPSISLLQNRWVRYGFSGVGEEHIENASWVRLNELSLSYKIFPKVGNAKREMSFSFIGKNLFLITPYSGVDPGTALYGYSSGTGLDLFNAPSLKSYHFQITFKI